MIDPQITGTRGITRTNCDAVRYNPTINAFVFLCAPKIDTSEFSHDSNRLNQIIAKAEANFIVDTYTTNQQYADQNQVYFNYNGMDAGYDNKFIRGCPR